MNGYYGYPYYSVPYGTTMRGAGIPVMQSLGARSIAPGIASSVTRPGILSSIASATKNFSFTGLLNGTSKTLGVINQAIPIFYQVKPIWNNAKTMFRVMKEVNSDDSDQKIKEKIKNVKFDTIKDDNSIKKEKQNVDTPTFYA